MSADEDLLKRAGRRIHSARLLAHVEGGYGTYGNPREAARDFIDVVIEEIEAATSSALQLEVWKVALDAEKLIVDDPFFKPFAGAVHQELRCRLGEIEPVNGSEDPDRLKREIYFATRALREDAIKRSGRTSRDIAKRSRVHGPDFGKWVSDRSKKLSPVKGRSGKADRIEAVLLELLSNLSPKE
jgi:hypothetical protein